MRLPSPGLMRVFAMELFTKLFGDLLLFVYHCFDRIVINGYLSGLSRPEQVVYFFRKVVGVTVLSKEVLSQRTAEYQNWVEAFARNHNVPVEWAEKGVRECQIFCVRGFRDGRNVMCSCISRSPPSNAWWPTKAGQQALSRPLAAEGGGRRPAFTGLADRPYSYHRV